MSVALCQSLFAQKIIENSETPKGKAKTLVFTEDLVLEAEIDGEPLLLVDSRTKIIPDPRGYMYITDRAENRLLEFDPDGNFVRVAANKGQGPGELQGIRSFTILDDNTGVMLDGPPIGVPKLKIFDENRKVTEESFLRSFGFPAVLWTSPNGQLNASIYSNMNQAENRIDTRTSILSKDLDVLEVIYEAHLGRLDTSRIQDSDYWSEHLSGILKSLFKGFGVIAFAPDNHVYTAVANQYEITKWSPDLGKKVMVVRRNYKPIPNSDAHIGAIVDVMVENFTGIPLLQNILTRPVLKRAVDLSEPPPGKNPIFGIIPMEKDGILVIHDIDLSNGNNLVDIFSNEGVFMGQVSMSGFGFMGVDAGLFLPRMIFRNGYAYTVLSDEYGENTAVRFTYKLVDKES
jgi:hypothetical protein